MPAMILDRTGKRDTVAGHLCETWRVIDKKTKATAFEVCTAEGLDRSETVIIGWEIAPPFLQSSWMKQLAKEGGFTLRSISYDGEREEGRTEVTSIEKKDLEDSFFTIPANYSKQDIR